MTFEEALYNAAQAIYESTGGATEATSVIYRMKDGSFGFARPQSSNEKASVKATLRFPKESALAALVHNHPELLNSTGKDGEQNLFSEVDINTARELGVMSAIAYGPGMNIRTFEPGADKVSKVPRQGTRIGGELSALGKLFDHIPEVRVTARKLGTALEQVASR